MSLLPFLLVTVGGTVAVVLARRSERWASGVGLLALVAALATAVAITPDQVMQLEGGGLVTTAFQRLFLVLGALVGLGLALIGTAAGQRRDAAAATLAVLGTSAVALALPDPQTAVLAATAGGAFGAVVCVGPGGGRVGAGVGMRAVRATVIAGVMALAAAAWIGRDLSELVAQPVVFGLAYLTMAVAVAIRFGLIPLHAWAARLTEAVPESTLPLVTAWGPAALAVVALAWTDRSIAPLLVDVDQARIAIVAIALLTIGLAWVAATIQDDLEHIVGYAIIGDAAIMLLALAALDPAAWAPARTWLLAFIVVRSAFAAWAAAMRLTFGTGRVPELRGWARRSPLLGVTLGVVALASIGLPGLAAFEARSTILGLVLGGPVLIAAWLGVLAAAVYYGRLLAVGIAAPDPGLPPVARLPLVRPVELTALRGWLAMTWSDNRTFLAAVLAAALTVIGLAVSTGWLETTEAAAGLPPTLESGADPVAPTDGS